MFDSEYSISTVLNSLEAVLQIEYAEELRVCDVVDKAVERMENRYGVTLDKSVYELQQESQLTADNINLFLRDVRTCLEQLSFFIELKVYHKNVPISLADVNYLGYAKKQLMTALKYLQDEKLYKQHHEEVITPLYNTLDNINICSTKRMFVDLLMLERLGVIEGVAIIAQLLYLGGLMK